MPRGAPAVPVRNLGARLSCGRGHKLRCALGVRKPGAPRGCSRSSSAGAALVRCVWRSNPHGFGYLEQVGLSSCSEFRMASAFSVYMPLILVIKITAIVTSASTGAVAITFSCAMIVILAFTTSCEHPSAAAACKPRRCNPAALLRQWWLSVRASCAPGRRPWSSLLPMQLAL